MAVGKEERQTVKVFFFEIVRRNSRILSKLARKRTHYLALYVVHEVFTGDLLRIHEQK